MVWSNRIQTVRIYIHIYIYKLRIQSGGFFVSEDYHAKDNENSPYDKLEVCAYFANQIHTKKLR